MNPLVHGPILGTLLRLTWPSLVAMSSLMVVGVVETWVIGQLGLASLAAVSLVFPSIILMQNMASGSLGGSVAALVSQELGRGRPAHASIAAFHGLVCAFTLGTVFLVFYMTCGPWLYHLLGGRDEVLEIASIYSYAVLSTLPVMWWWMTMSAILRGTGNMRLPARITLATSAMQIVIGIGLGLGVAGLPRLGMVGVALGQVIPMLLAASFLFWYVASGQAPIRFRVDGRLPRLQLSVFVAILKPGLIACFNPIQAMLIVMIVGRMVAEFGVAPLAAFGIGTRLEMLLLNIIWAVGIASAPIIGMSLGSNQVARARRAAWTACAVSASLMACVGGVLAVFPDLWLRLFTSDPETLEAGRVFLLWVGPCLVFFGAGSSLYYSSQGASRVLGPVLASATRLVVIVGGGLWLQARQGTVEDVFFLIGFAMVTFGLGAMLAMRLTRWEPRPLPGPQPAATAAAS